MTPPGQLFVTDFDGTLLTDDRRITSRDLDTLERLRGESLLLALDLPVDFLIFSTGAGVYDLNSNNLLLSRDIPNSGIKKICRCFDALGYDYMVHKAIPDTPYFQYKESGLNHNPDFYHRIDLYPGFGCPLDHPDSLYERATEVLAILPGGICPEAFANIEARLDRFSVIHATSPLDHRSAWIEVFHPEVSKSRSVDWLANRLGIDRDRVVAVGNDYNDRDLLAWAGTGLLVANGPEDMKGEFSGVAANTDCGVSDAARVAGLLP